MYENNGYDAERGALMAERRMFAKSMLDADRFLELPLAAQALYFHMGLNADDEGFLGNARRIMRGIGASRKELAALMEAGYLMAFPSGVIVICHWLQHNSIRADRRQPTVYAQERAQLTVNAQGIYELATEETTVSAQEIVQEAPQAAEQEPVSAHAAAQQSAPNPPTIEEVRAFCQAEGIGVSPERFVRYNEAMGWRRGNTPIRDWRALLRSWPPDRKPPELAAAPSYASIDLNALLSQPIT